MERCREVAGYLFKSAVREERGFPERLVAVDEILSEIATSISVPSNNLVKTLHSKKSGDKR